MFFTKQKYSLVQSIPLRGESLSLYQAPLVETSITEIIEKIPRRFPLTVFVSRDNQRTYLFIGNSTLLEREDLPLFKSYPLLYLRPFIAPFFKSTWPSYLESEKVFLFEHIVIKEGDKLTLLSWQIPRALHFLKTSDVCTEKTHPITESKWCKQVEQIKERISTNELKKVVLARTKEITSPLNGRELLTRALSKKESGHYLFFAELDEKRSFISRSPERLFKIRERELLCEAVAGTLDRNEKTPDQKLIEEHQLVVTDVENVLSSSGAKEIKRDPLDLKKAGALTHLYTSFKAVFDGCPLSLLDSLHPTPAMGGVPREDALKVILELENFDRGLFAAPVGVIGPTTEIIVGIRSALLFANQMTLFAGAGIVFKSQGELEWEETERKMEEMLSLTRF